MNLPASIRGSRAAFVFLTRLPVGGFPYSAEDFRWAPAHFPLVGILVGALGSAVLWTATPLGSVLAAALAVTATVCATGAFHEDGLADTIDALGGAHGQKKILEILKDSRIGTYGATALCLSLVFRIGALSELGSTGVPLLVLVNGLARTGPVWMMAALPYVSGEGAKGASVARGGGLAQSAIAGLWMLVACGIGVWGGVRPIVALALSVAMTLISLWLGRWFRARAGGITGDFLGATEQINEIALLLLGLALLRSGL